ncbi:MAG: ABC transporter substrate-binding protein, partial [Clostridia bacterium]|nr:ABC transporter substrate-binding protein [Clostridia bacterium]
MEKFLNTFWYLYAKEPEFKNRFLNGKGVCIPHFAKLLNALDSVSGAKRESFAKELYDLEIAVLEHEKEEVFNFTKKFDYRS